MKFVVWDVWFVLMFYCYLLVMYSYRSGLFEWWLWCWLYWWKIKLLIDCLMIQWMKWWSYNFQFDVWLSLNVWSGSSLKIWWNVACKLCSKRSYWIQCENWWNVVHGGAEGCSLQSGGFSSLLGEAGKWEQGVVAPFQERLVNEIRGS